jgi:hypothetical protein
MVPRRIDSANGSDCLVSIGYSGFVKLAPKPPTGLFPSVQYAANGVNMHFVGKGLGIASSASPRAGKAHCMVYEGIGVV